MCRDVGTGFEEEANDWRATPQTCMKDGAPPVFIIGVHKREIFRQPRPDRLQVASRRCFMNGKFSHGKKRQVRDVIWCQSIKVNLPHDLTERPLRLSRCEAR